jgi:hypothetical protein
MFTRAIDSLARGRTALRTPQDPGFRVVRARASRESGLPQYHLAAVNTDSQ